MATMRHKLNFPGKLPRWATDAARTLEPAEGLKDTGWADSNKPPARIMNWLQNTAWSWLKTVAATSVSNWWRSSGSQFSTDAPRGIFYHPACGVAGATGPRWVVTAYDFGTGRVRIYGSLDGFNWTNYGLIGTGFVAQHAIGIDRTRFIFVCDSGDEVWYSLTGQAVWTEDTGFNGTAPKALCTKYPDSDFIVVGGTNIRFAVGGVGMPWSTPSTPPSLGADWISAVIRVADTTWIAFSETDGKGYISIDDCDNWAALPIHPSDVVAGLRIFSSDFDDTTSTICVIGNLTPSLVQHVLYSRDLGSTWTEGVIHGHEISHPTAKKGYMGDVYACGCGVWVAHAGCYDGSARGSILVSTDDGETWYPAEYLSNIDKDLDANIWNFCSNGRMLLAAAGDGGGGSDYGSIYHSLALPGKIE